MRLNYLYTLIIIFMFIGTKAMETSSNNNINIEASYKQLNSTKLSFVAYKKAIEGYNMYKTWVLHQMAKYITTTMFTNVMIKYLSY